MSLACCDPPNSEELLPAAPTEPKPPNVGFAALVFVVLLLLLFALLAASFALKPPKAGFGASPVPAVVLEAPNENGEAAGLTALAPCCVFIPKPPNAGFVCPLSLVVVAPIAENAFPCCVLELPAAEPKLAKALPLVWPPVLPKREEAPVLVLVFPVVDTFCPDPVPANKLELLFPPEAFPAVEKLKVGFELKLILLINEPL